MAVTAAGERHASFNICDIAFRKFKFVFIKGNAGVIKADGEKGGIEAIWKFAFHIVKASSDDFI